MASRTLHAILAGINTYPSPVKPLEGCLHDVNSWQQYLESESSHFNLKITPLLNEAVTKQALSYSLQAALANASSDDVVFFFFSGHGTREEADPVFSIYEQDDSIECLVCHDSIQQHSGKITYDLLSDKELHFIISEHTKPGTHVLMIFDCCHSGGITRNAWLSGEHGDYIERRLALRDIESHTAPMRRWDKFLFAEKYSRAHIEKAGWLNSVAPKPHITFSACQNDESAYEYNGRGIFSANLLNILQRTNGSISYYDLQSRARMFIQNQFRQTPEVYVSRNHENDLLRTFLDKTTLSSSFGCTVFHKKHIGWAIDLGALHGITTGSGPVSLTIDNVQYPFNIHEVFSNYSLLDIPADAEKMMDPQSGYSAFVENHFSGNTSFFVLNDNENQIVAEQLRSTIISWLKANHKDFLLTDNRTNASYLVKALKEHITICQNDDIMRPATQISLADTDPITRCIQFMDHIAQWEYIRSISNPGFKGNEYPIVFNFYRVNRNHQKQEMVTRGDTIEFDYEKNREADRAGGLKASITNRSSTKYYCSILYLSNLFEVSGNILIGKVIGLNPGETAWINNGDVVEFELEPHIVQYNYPHSIFYLKLISSTTPFQVETLEQSPLPSPVINNTRADSDLAFNEIKTSGRNPDKKISWFTRTVCFKGRNPNFQQIKPLSS